jgi:hypothetical protein
MLLRDLNAKVDRGDIFKLKIGNESLHKIGDDNKIRAAHFPHPTVDRSAMAL